MYNIVEDTMKYTREKIENAVKSSNSVVEVVSKLGGNPNSGGTYSLVRKKIKEYEIDLSHFVPHKPVKTTKKHYTERLVKRNQSSRRENARILRSALIDSGKNYACSVCGLSSWQGKSLTLQVDHINGDCCDDREENLRFLCPNCHTQTSTWGNSKETNKYFCSCGEEIWKNSTYCKSCASKVNNKRKVEDRPSKEQLSKDIKDLGYCGTGRKYGVSDNAIRKWMK